MPIQLPAPVIEHHDSFVVVRDDLLPGGSKSRVLFELLQDHPAQEFVYVGLAEGCTHWALAYAARAFGKQATIFIAERRRENWTPFTLEAEKLGAQIIAVKPEDTSTLNERAEMYCGARPETCLLPRGLDTAAFRRAFVTAAAQIQPVPKEVWCASSSGTLTRALQAAWPKAEHHAVIVREGFGDTGRAVRHFASIAFESAASVLPPFPSAPHFDAKAWTVMQREGRPGALFWNVAP